MINILYSKDWEEYELLDTGESEKLERFGDHILARPYEDAVWKRTLTAEWKKADGRFVSSKDGGKSGWRMNRTFAERWPMEYKGIKFIASPTPFRHLGFFPEQSAHWDFIEEKISGVRGPLTRPVKFLNLFGYTGVASLFALRAGAEVTHVDASKQSIDWAKENQKLSGLEDLPMRVILDDVLKFMEREEKRGNKYDCIIMDPPKFGRGPKGEVWKIEENLAQLLDQARKILSDDPLFVILNSYAIDSSSLSLGYALSEAMKDLGGKTESGELCLLEKSNGRLIPLSNTAIWSR
ncbi:MAG TPA: class I SAM-dependent methyltransferase [Candidatus Paceibacterota bacterium]|nr:class I SAM-dependent methyltransferase [Candidatus Paceibacterota bacterium]